MSNPASKPVIAKSAAQLLEDQKLRFQALVQRRMKVQFELESAARQFAEAQAEAIQEFGTGDLDALRALFLQREEDNARKVAMFARELDALETVISDTEQQLVS